MTPQMGREKPRWVGQLGEWVMPAKTVNGVNEAHQFKISSGVP